jgi:hypothetical protein
VSALVSIKRRYANKPVYAGLGSEFTIGIIARYDERDGFDAGLLTSLVVDDFGFITVFQPSAGTCISILPSVPPVPGWIETMAFGVLLTRGAPRSHEAMSSDQRYLMLFRCMDCLLLPKQARP